MHLMVINKGAVHPDRQAGTGWQEQHIAVSKEVFRAHLVQDSTGVHL